MRLAFMGSPDFAVPALTALHAAGHDIAAVYCQPPRPAGRGNRVRRCAVHEAADRLGLPVRSPSRLRQDDAAQADFVALDLDVAVVAAYGLILPRAMLDAPRLGCVNIHASLLPRWRGASPIQAAIMAGDPRSGITIMRMEEGLDTGPIYGRATLPLGPRVTTSELHDALAQLGADAIQTALAGLPDATPQPAEGVTYAAKLTRADGKLDWSQDAATLDRHIRALNPWPGTFATMNGETLKILAATPEPGSGPPGQILDAGLLVACGTGALRLTRVQRPGRPAMAGDAMLRGMPGGESLILR